VWLLLLAALAIRLAFVFATPGYELVHDARDYDRHAASLAAGDGYALALGRPTAFRPPGYPYLLAGVYTLAGVDTRNDPDGILAARLAGALLGTLVVALIGVLAAQLWGRRAALVAMGLAAIYVPLILVGAAVMSETLFVALLLATLVAALAHRRSRHRYRLALLAGVLAGLAILTRANAAVLLLPLGLAVWDARPRFGVRALAPPVALFVAAILVVAPWTVRNQVVFGTFVPVSTQLGSALAGTYNDQARTDKENPASWRSVRRVPAYAHIWAGVRTRPEPELDHELREVSKRYIAEHPAYVAQVGWWSTARMLDLTGLEWSRHTTGTIGIAPRWADVSVACFWAFALLALAGACTRRARQAPLFVWLVPVLMYLSVVFLVVETPRYRTGIDPFIVILAALALLSAADARAGFRRRGARGSPAPAPR
jgi:4-amino-4-deoxy-L-arabinose transferase-like glycosyltransferase